MPYLTFSKLKAYKKAENLSKEIKELSKTIPKVEKNDLRSRFKYNLTFTLRSTKLVWVKDRNRKDFIDRMGQVIANNSELESLLSEAKSKGFINAEIYEHFFEECRELRDLQLQMFNNASVYFEQGKAPENWFDL